MRKELIKLYRIYFFYPQESIEKMRLERKNSNRIFILPISEKGALKMRKAYKKLTYADRQEIEQMSERGEKPKAIADATGVCFQTIYRELQRGKDKDGKEKYDRINLTVPKGRKEEIKKKAAAAGQSVNEYINALIDNDK